MVRSGQVIELNTHELHKIHNNVVNTSGKHNFLYAPIFTNWGRVSEKHGVLPQSYIKKEHFIN